MFMVAGGHFAGAIVQVNKSDEEKAEEAEEALTATSGRRKKQKKPKPETEVLRHKTFHRYTSSCQPSLLFISNLPDRQQNSTEKTGRITICQ
jgi:hypothetical protein